MSRAWYVLASALICIALHELPGDLLMYGIISSMNATVKVWPGNRPDDGSNDMQRAQPSMEPSAWERRRLDGPQRSRRTTPAVPSFPSMWGATPEWAALGWSGSPTLPRSRGRAAGAAPDHDTQFFLESNDDPSPRLSTAAWTGLDLLCVRGESCWGKVLTTYLILSSGRLSARRLKETRPRLTLYNYLMLQTVKRAPSPSSPEPRVRSIRWMRITASQHHPIPPLDRMPSRRRIPQQVDTARQSGRRSPARRPVDSFGESASGRALRTLLGSSLRIDVVSSMLYTQDQAYQESAWNAGCGRIPLVVSVSQVLDVKSPRRT